MRESNGKRQQIDEVKRETEGNVCTCSQTSIAYHAQTYLFVCVRHSVRMRTPSIVTDELQFL